MKLTAIVIFAFAVLPTLASAEKSAGEQVQSTSNTVVRKVKKGTHRVQEALCTDGEVKCAGKKVMNRVDETGATIKDKVKETVDEKK